MLDGIVSHLTSAEASVSIRKKKKAKIQETSDAIPPKSWHLRALVLSSLKNCFLHDTGSLKFLDTNNFQVILSLNFTFFSWIKHISLSLGVLTSIQNVLFSTGATEAYCITACC